MPNHRTPLAKAKLTGTDKKHPDRFGDRTEPELSGDKLGPAPEWFDAVSQQVWHEFAQDIPWLVREDRAAVTTAVLAQAQIRIAVAVGAPIKSAMLMAANTALAKLGATPVDRTKVHQPKEPDVGDENDPWSKFGNKAH
jgi:phage terminase small subunit